MTYHIARNDREIAVAEEGQIKTGLGTGLYFPTDHVWREGMGGWKPAGEVFGPHTPTIRNDRVSDDARDLHTVGVLERIKRLIGLRTSRNLHQPSDEDAPVKRQIGIVGGISAVLLVGWVVYYVSIEVPERRAAREATNDCIGKARNIVTACKLYSSDHDGKYPADLNALVQEGLLQRSGLSGMRKTVNADMGYEYFGDKMTDSDDGGWILFMTRWQDSDGRRIVAHNDSAVGLEVPQDKNILHAALKGSTLFESLHAPPMVRNDVKAPVKPTPPVETKANAEQFAIGEIMRSRNHEVTVLSADTRQKVGGELFEQVASDGGVYLAVLWSYKNISTKPINMFNHPVIHLIAPDGTQYNEDLGAGVAFASQSKIDAKILSDLNPGIKVNTATVFEVSREALSDLSQWSLVIKADTLMKVRLGR